ncbi:MAG: trigger factor [Candidatus Firestonebacteria bacterium]|nr:trigger factor [Candidatus Firestonebacteria bacterium]
MLKIDLQEKGETTRVLQVEIPLEAVEKEFSRVEQNVQRGTTLPGFRKGRVPMDVIKKKYQHAIREEVMERLLSDSYRRALEETNSVPILQPRFENIMLDPGQPLTYQLTLEVLPKVKLGNYQSLKLTRKKTKVTDEQVAAILERLRAQNAILTPVEGRPSQAGDAVTIDFAGTLEGKPVPNTQAQDYAVEIGSGQTIPEFDQNLGGLNLNESKTFPAKFPEDYHATEIAGKTVEFTVTLKSIKEKKLADLNDDFAKDMGPFAGLDELKDRIRKDLETQQDQENREHLKEQIMDQLGKMVNAKIPEVLVERSLDKLIRDRENRLKEQGSTWEKSGTTPEAVREQNHGQVEFQLRANLALREIGLLEKIEISADDVNAEVERLARISRQPVGTLKDYLKQSDRWEDLRDRLRDDKTLDWLIGKAKIQETT